MAIRCTACSPSECGRRALAGASGSAKDAALLVAMGMLLLVGLAGRDPRLPQRRPRVRLALAVALMAGLGVVVDAVAASASAVHGLSVRGQIGRASCRER